jgi:hypothetical protein
MRFLGHNRSICRVDCYHLNPYTSDSHALAITPVIRSSTTVTALVETTAGVVHSMHQ